MITLDYNLNLIFDCSDYYRLKDIIEKSESYRLLSKMEIPKSHTVLEFWNKKGDTLVRIVESLDEGHIFIVNDYMKNLQS